MNALGQPSSVLVLGGTSDIATAIVRRLVADGTRRVVLAGRSTAELDRRAASITGAEVTTVVFDAQETDAHGKVVDEVFGGDDIDLVVLAFGLLGHGQGLDVDPADAVRLARTNYVGAVSVGMHVAHRLRAQGHGTLVVLSSVAGERARKTNFVYGSTKAGLDAWAQGLGDALHGSGSRVMIVRPGFVKSKMTEGLPEVPFSTTPEAVATSVVRGLQRGSETIWSPAILRLVMTVLRHLPRAVFRRLPI
jgi:decaprenylphospho-beta-D-erythro-pentofuranosid-2-ulose 2-reductase